MRTHVRLPSEAGILYLTRNLDLIHAQLYEGLRFSPGQVSADDLLDDVNTDLITPVWTCFDHDPKDIARNAYAGLTREGERLFRQDALIEGDFKVVVSGRRKGTGSSRETAAQAERWAGIEIVVADSFAPIYLRNCINLGLLTCDHETFAQLLAGETLDIDAFTRGEDELTKLVVAYGGLIPFVAAMRVGEVALPDNGTAARAMTMAEKIYAARSVGSGTGTARCVKPGDAVVCRIDVGYSYEFTTPQVDAFLTDAFGSDYELDTPSRLAVFEDHMVFAESVPRFAPFLGKIDTMRGLQRRFQARTGVRDFSVRDGVSPGICHQVGREKLISPGDMVLATDSHTCMGGGNNALAFGVGATEYAACAWSGLAPVVVPESIRFELIGALPSNCTAKDLMLVILRDFARVDATLGRAMEFGGPGLASLSPDERATLCNMATECSARTAICEADATLANWIAQRRPETSPSALLERAVAPDPGATYDGGVHVIDLSRLEPMLAHPGDPERGIPSDPTNGIAVREIGDVPIAIAYGGSCTAGKIDDMAFYADVCAQQYAAGRKVADGVRFFIQFGSEEVREVAHARGWIELFEDCGVTLINPGCGACIGCGPGTSDDASQVTVSAINRNYQGRSGPGRMYLASPLTVAASAFAGRICGYEPDNRR
jgi:3-isopropylmalate/(R)-2-methylmalate dehydratase large subunit